MSWTATRFTPLHCKRESMSLGKHPAGGRSIAPVGADAGNSVPGDWRVEKPETFPLSSVIILMTLSSPVKIAARHPNPAHLCLHPRSLYPQLPPAATPCVQTSVVTMLARRDAFLAHCPAARTLSLRSMRREGRGREGEHDTHQATCQRRHVCVCVDNVCACLSAAKLSACLCAYAQAPGMFG